MKEVAATPDGGTAVLGTPVTDVGKLTLTRFPGDALLLLYPFLAAYLQGAAVEPVVQLKAVPLVNPWWPVCKPCASTNKSMAPAVQAASAAFCAAWRWNHRLLMSTEIAPAPSKTRARASTTNTNAWPHSARRCPDFLQRFLIILRVLSSLGAGVRFF
jgi:hypothetical protein